MPDGELTPPSIQDGPGGWEPDAPGDRGIRRGYLSPEEGQKLARDCYSAATNWVNSGKRARWTESLRAFQSLHSIDSKYYSREYGHRTTLFRPKSRAMVRKSEAQTAAAFFSNEDVVNIQPADEDNKEQAASAAVMQELLQYRLTKPTGEGGIPWFLTLVGARQDGEVMGLCAAKAYWKYEEVNHGPRIVPAIDPHTGAMLRGADGQIQIREEDDIEKVHDKPVVDLIPMENIRFEPGADWRNVVEASPYLIYQIAMYVSDVREMMDKGEWFPMPDSAMRSATDIDDDTTRRAREPGRVPGKDHDAWKPKDFDIVWVHENIIRWAGRDWHFYTLGRQAAMLTNPRPLEEVYLHGMRPFTIGFVVVETHKTYPASKIELVRDLQRATNDDWNLRFDQMKMSLMPRQFIKQGVGIEVVDVRTFIPGKVVVTKDPQTDIVWDRPPEPSQAAYAEQDRINLDFDELVGDFSNSSVQATQIQEQSATGMHLMSGQASGMNEYELRVFAESFVEPLLRQLVHLIRAYETDQTVLAICGKRAKIEQKYGISAVTDALLDKDATVKVNVGIGATNPAIKMRNFLMAAESLQKFFGPVLAQGINFEEVLHEVFALAGYKDGDRFVVPGFDFQKAIQAMQQGEKGGQNPQIAQQTAQARVQAAQIAAQGKIQERQIAAQADARSDQLEMQRTQMSEKAETFRALLGHTADLFGQHVARQHEVMHPQPVVVGKPQGAPHVPA